MGKVLQWQYIGFNSPKIHKAMQIGCKSFESWNSNVGMYLLLHCIASSSYSRRLVA